MPRPIVATFYSPEYAEDALRLRSSVKTFGYDYDEAVVDSPTSWEGGCAMKAAALNQLLARHERFVYLDADQWLIDEIPWLTQFEGEIALAIHPPPREGVRWRSQKYRLHGNRYGERFLTGVMAIKRTRRVQKLFAEWERLCKLHSDEWDEQLLYHAWRKMHDGSPTVFAVPDDYRVIPLGGKALRIAHNSGSNRHWQLHNRRVKPERKILLIGSAPYVPDWWQRHGEEYLEAGYSPVCMNNAWRAIPAEDIHYWIRPADFAGEEPPSCIPRNDRLRADRTCTMRMWRCRPDWDVNLYTTLTHSLYHVSNEAYYDSVRLIVHVVGSDFDYRGAETHFYGNGRPDPLRHGTDRLRKALAKVAAVYQCRGHSLYNAGGHEWTMLPFARAVSPKQKEQTYMITPERITLEESRTKIVYELPRDLYKTANGIPCEAGDTNRKVLLGRRGARIPMAQAIKYGLVVIHDERPKKIEHAANVKAKGTGKTDSESEPALTAGKELTAPKRGKKKTVS